LVTSTNIVLAPRRQERQVRKFNFFAAPSTLLRTCFAPLREIFRVLVAASPRSVSVVKRDWDISPWRRRGRRVGKIRTPKFPIQNFTLRLCGKGNPRWNTNRAVFSKRWLRPQPAIATWPKLCLRRPSWILRQSRTRNRYPR